MARRWLADGELEVITLRPHASTVWFPITVLLLTAAGVGAGWRAIPDDYADLRWALIGLAGLLLLIFVLIPVARWRNTRYVLTTRRLLTRMGPFGKVVHDIPLSVVRQVDFRRGAIGWLTGCGNLRVVTIDGFWLDLRQMPDVKRVRAVINELAAQRHPDRWHPAAGSQRAWASA